MSDLVETLFLGGWLAAVANTVLSLFYYLRVIAPACFGSQPGPVAVLGRTTVSVSISMPSSSRWN